MDKVVAEVSREADRRRDASVGFLRALIGAQRQGESAVQAMVADAALRIGCSVEHVRYRPSEVPMVAEFASARAIDADARTSVVARRPGRGGGRSLVLFAHPDSEPVAGTDRWRHDPFAGAIVDGRIYGWGVADDLSGVAIMVQALEAVVAASMQPAGDVIVASTPSKRHARGVSALLHGGLTADAALYLHPAESGGGMREIKAFASGQVEFKVTIEGREPETTEPSHTAFAHRAVNPFDKAILVHQALTELGEWRAARVRHPLLDAAVGRSTNLLVASVECGRPDMFSRIAPHCILSGALSFPPPETLAAIQGQIEASVNAAASRDAWLSAHRPCIEWVSGVTGAEVLDSHALYRAVAEAINAVSGEAPCVNPMHTSSDIRNPIVQKGIPTVGFGPLCGDLTQNGRHDEWVDLEDYLRAIKVAARAIVAWTGAT
jgi:acetylornithine deacetylase